MRSHLSYLAALSALIAGCSSDGEDIPKIQSACGIATDYVQRFVDDAERLRADNADAPKIIAVRKVPYKLLPFVAKNGADVARSPRTIHQIADWRAISRLSDESVVGSCPTLESWLSVHAILADDEQIESLTTGDEWGAHVLSIAMPVFTADKKHAVIFASKGVGGTAGVGVLAIYSKSTDGEWQLVSEETRWVS